MLVKIWLHARLRADACQRFFELFSEERIFFVVWDRRAAVFHVDGAIVDTLFTGPATIAPGCVGSEPSSEPQRFFARAEMGVEPVAAHRRCADHANRFIVLASDFFRR